MIDAFHPDQTLDVHADLAPGVPINALSLNLHHIREAVALVEMLLTEAADRNGEMAYSPATLAAVLGGVETQLSLQEWLCLHAYNTSTATCTATGGKDE